MVYELIGWTSLSMSLKKQTIEVLREIGIPNGLKGFRYLQRAIALVVQNPNILQQNLGTELYQLIAKEFCTAPYSVKRAMLYAIEVAWKRGNIEIFQKYFGNTIYRYKGSPPLSEFIARMADYLSLQMTPHENLLETQITDLLKQSGIFFYIKGFRYLRHAIALVIQEPHIVQKPTKDLYPKVARKFGVAPGNAERAIRYAVETAWLLHCDDIAVAGGTAT